MGRTVTELGGSLRDVVRARRVSPSIAIELAAAGGAALVAMLFTANAAVAGEVSSQAAGLFLILVVVLGALAAGLAVLEPWAGLLAWLIVMPVLNASRLGRTLGGVFVTDSTILVACLVLGIVLAWRSGRLRPQRIPGPVTALATAASVVAIMSGALAADPGLGLTIALHGVVEPAIVALIACLLIDRRSRVVGLAVAMALSVAIATLYNLERLLKLTFDLAVAQGDRTGFARFTYYNVGIYGDMLVMTLPLAIGLLLYARTRTTSRPVRLAVMGLIVLLAIGLYLTFTKGPWLAGLLVITGLLVVTEASWRARAVTVLVAALLAMLIVPYPLYAIRAIDSALADRMLTVVQGLQGGNRADSWDPETAEGEVSITERALATRAAVAMAIDHPLIGVGPGDFADAYATQYKPPEATRSLHSAHDMFADVAAEFGIPLAALLVVAFFGAGLVAIALGRRGPPETRVLGLALGASVAGFLIVGFTFGVDLYRPYRIMNSDVLFAALLLAGIVALMRTRRLEPDDSTSATP
jgi:putative inorganic carbon (hco3(-)) transporter